MLCSRLFSPIFPPHFPQCLPLSYLPCICFCSCPLFSSPLLISPSFSFCLSSLLCVSPSHPSFFYFWPLCFLSVLFLCLFEALSPALLPGFISNFPPLSLFLLFSLIPLVLSFLPCFLPLLPFPLSPHFSTQPFFLILLSHLIFFFLSALFSFYVAALPLFSIFISPPLSSLLGPSLFFPLSAFLSSPLAFSSSFCLYPHLSPFLPPSLPLFLCLLF